MFPRPCSEFPNDNPALYEAVVEAVVPAAADSRGAPPEAATDLLELENELELEPERCEAAPSTHTPDEPADPFRSLAGVLDGVARDAGATDDLAAALRGLLGLERFEAAALPESSVEALASGMQLERTAGGVQRTEAFAQTVRAWQAILRGEDDDLSRCGAATLDEWTADLIARVIGNPVLAAQLRRDLRSKGVAAFGLVAEAA